MVVHWRKKRGPHLVEKRFGQRSRRYRDGHYCDHCSGREVRGRRLDHHALHSSADLLFCGRARHYHSVVMSTSCTLPIVPANHANPPLAIVPVDRWSHIAKQGLELASQLTPQVIAVHVDPEEHSELLHEDWERLRNRAISRGGPSVPELVMIPSPYRFVMAPLVQYILTCQTNIRMPHRGRDSSPLGRRTARLAKWRDYVAFPVFVKQFRMLLRVDVDPITCG